LKARPGIKCRDNRPGDAMESGGQDAAPGDRDRPASAGPAKV